MKKLLATKKHQKILAASAAVLAFSLSACGGGGGSLSRDTSL
jgi:hypothetical protein